MCCKVAMVWTLSIQGDIPFAQNNTTINGTWQLLAYLSGPCWSASQLYRLSPIDCNRTGYYFPWSSNDRVNPCSVRHWGFSRVPAIYPDPTTFPPDVWSPLVFVQACASYIIISMHLYLSLYQIFYTMPPYLSVNWCAGRWPPAFSWQQLIAGSHFCCRFSGTVCFAHDPFPSLQTTDGFCALFSSP